MKVKLVSMSEQESSLDKEIEQILGRAIDGKDLRMLYEIDIKTLNQLNIGCNNKFDGFVQHFVRNLLQLINFYKGKCHHSKVLQGLQCKERGRNNEVHEKEIRTSP
jgi:hypothetical protein